MSLEGSKHPFLEKYFSIRLIAANGIIAALYAVITIACGPLSYEFMQFRISEFLNLLVFFNPSYTLGLTLGCLIANLFSSVGPIDIALGTATTLVACIIMIVYSHYVKNLFSTGWIPCLANALVVPFIIYLSSLGTSEEMILEPAIYFTMFGWVFLGEFVCIVAFGYPVFLILTKKNKHFLKAILPTRNTDYKW